MPQELVAPVEPKRWALANHRIIATLLFLVFIAGGLILTKDFLMKLDQADTFQAVFLTNGQVYFGHLKIASSEWAELTNIYYLQVNQPLQNQQQEQADEQQQSQPQLTLIKLGEELHGPIDRMVINREHILFIEDLKESGPVVQTIRQSGGPQ